MAGMLGKMFPEAQFLITGCVGPQARPQPQRPQPASELTRCSRAGRPGLSREARAALRRAGDRTATRVERASALAAARLTAPLKQANAHGPNECLDVEYAKKLTACVASVIADHACVPDWLAACSGDPALKKRRARPAPPRFLPACTAAPGASMLQLRTQGFGAVRGMITGSVRGDPSHDSRRRKDSSFLPDCPCPPGMEPGQPHQMR
eukprot:SAG11_NODE_146_length_14788_cov_5.672884_15_plen_208_part_00